MASKHARNAGGATEIADDALRESFARLPDLHDLLRCAATCRRWRRLVTDRAFLRRAGLWPDTAHRPCVLAGIFYQNSSPTGLPRLNRDNYYPPQFLSLQAGGTHLSFDAFGAFADDVELFDLARPLASRRGFLLARISPHGEYLGPKLHLAVCRPLVNKRTTCLLPPPPFNMNQHYWNSNLTGCAILTAADHADNGSTTNPDHKQQQPTTMFQVLLIYTNNDNGFLYACTYSSDAGTWSAPVECCRASGLISCGPRAGVVTRGGTVHWLFMDERNRDYYALNISVATSHVSLTAIPIKVQASVRRPPIPCIAGEDGRLSFVTIPDHHGVAELWTKQEQNVDDSQDHVRACDGVWQCSELTDLGSMSIYRVWFVESRGALLVHQQGGGFSVVDLKTKEKTPMHLNKDGPGYEGWFTDSCTSTYCRGHTGSTCGETPSVLYEMDLVFSHRISSRVSSQLGNEITRLII